MLLKCWIFQQVLYNVLKERYVMPRRLLMTGTPIQNNLSELWALMYFCMPSVFGTLEQFLSTFKEISDPTSGYYCPYFYFVLLNSKVFLLFQDCILLSSEIRMLYWMFKIFGFIWLMVCTFQRTCNYRFLVLNIRRSLS